MTVHSSITRPLLVLSLVATLLRSEPAASCPDDLRSALADLVAKLGAGTWAVRETAQYQLLELGSGNPDEVIPFCLRSFDSSDDPEILFRLKRVLFELATSFCFQPKGFLGVSLRGALSPLPDANHVWPIEIMQVVPDTAAERAGLLAGDRIIRIDNQPCTVEFDVKAIVRYISSRSPGDRITLTCLRGGHTVTREINLGERPDLPEDPPRELEKQAFFKRWLAESLETIRNTATGSDKKP